MLKQQKLQEIPRKNMAQFDKDDDIIDPESERSGKEKLFGYSGR